MSLGPLNMLMDNGAASDPSFMNYTATSVVHLTNYNNVTGYTFYAYFDYNKPADATTRNLIDG